MFLRSTKLLRNNFPRIISTVQGPQPRTYTSSARQDSSAALALLLVPAVLCAKGGFYCSIVYSAAKIYDARNDDDFSAVDQAEKFFIRLFTYPLIAGAFAFCWPVTIPGFIIYKIGAFMGGKVVDIAENMDDDDENIRKQ